MSVPIQRLLELHPELNCNELREYRKYSTWMKKNDSYMSFYAIPSHTKEGYVHKSTGFNMFEKEATPIPKRYVKYNVRKKKIKEYYCDPKRELLKRDNAECRRIGRLHRRDKAYFTHDNGVRPFLVYVSPNIDGRHVITVYTYRSSKYFVPENAKPKKWMYIERKAKFQTKKRKKGEKNPVVFIGRGDAFRGKNKFIGNSILVQVQGKKYVHIGIEIFEFETPQENDIVRYQSIVGNNDVPYPAAIGQKNKDGKRNIYYLLDYLFGPMKMNRGDDVYGRYYNDKNIQRETKNLMSFKRIVERNWAKP